MFERLRIRPMPRHMSRCACCGHIDDCVAFDHDLAALSSGHGDVCEDCEEHVARAEITLRHRGFAIPTKSLLENDGGPDACCL